MEPNKLFIFCVAAIMMAGCANNKISKTPQLNFADNIVVAHRGAWKKNNIPENSIASLREAVRLGCTGSEFDVHLTADDSLVVNHDPTYHGLPIGKSTYAQLVQYKLSNGEKLPTLYEYLVEGMKQTTTTLVLELKPSDVSKERARISAEKAVALVKELKAEPWMMYISFDYDILLKILELDPKAKVAYLNGEKSPLQVKSDKIWGIDYHYNVFKKNPEWVDEAKKNNINLNVWTVNSEEDLKKFIDLKFDYITTNEPELLLELVNKKSR